jgi:dipeptidyl aminopeptidase/acylaminoacyl peptidase
VVLHHPAFQLCEPTWSPDGTQVAFIEGLMSDAGANGGDVFVLPVGGGRARNVTTGMHASATQLNWTKAGGLVAAAVMGGDAAFLRIDSSGTKGPQTLWRAGESVTRHWGVSAAFADDGQTTAVILDSGLQAPDVFLGPLGAWARVSSANRDVRSPADAVKSLTWSSDGREVQGWLLLPPMAGQGAALPLLVWVHGGPASAVTNDFDADVLLMLTQGYAVLRPNPRGSFGQGEAFTRANVKDFGRGDLRDILSGVNRAVRTGGVDANRVGIIGHSYGGYMTMFAVTQTTRFKAAVASAGIANWQSYYGQNKIDQWMLPYFGASVYVDPAVYARSSPMTFITQVKTPTLVLVGERDAECPAPQSYEFWHALKTLGQPTELVVYADEGHHFRDPAHVLDRVQREVGWFDRYLKGVSVPPSR